MTAALLLMATASGCSSAYYSAMESMGWEKRDILVSRVKEARDDQEEAKQAFKDALTRFTEVVKVDASELHAKYDKLSGDLKTCESEAAQVSKRIASVEKVSADLFGEWEKELDEYKNQELRRGSEQKLRDTKRRYEQLIGAMKKAEARMQPVLDAFRDQVLFLKHNLNAQAVASLEGTVTTLRGDVDRLIGEMEKSINEANTFIEAMGKEEAEKK
ncbi:MAG: DUF2959 domain-containing protein [Planctomycetes bacterium]|nr:DUF2959 domain-containing protein [Planctomycetota bacterium]